MPVTHDLDRAASFLRGQQERWLALGRAVAEEWAQVAQAAAMAAAPANTGKLRQSIQAGTDLQGSVEVGWQVRGAVWSDLPYAETMEGGRRAGARMPPVDAVALWVKRVWGAAKVKAVYDAWRVLARGRARRTRSARERRYRPTRASAAAMLRSVAYVVARSVARRGTKARLFFEAADRAAQRELPRIVERQMGRFAAGWR